MVPNELHSPMVYGVRSLVPLAIGLTFGVLISLVIFPQDEYTIPNGSCSIAQQPEALKIVDDSSADWQVVVKKIPSSAHRAQSNAAKVVRARFAATELGIREKLLVIILGQSSLSIALNASIAHHLPHLQIFIDVSRIDSDMASLPNLIQYRSNSQHPHTLHENYDWFYLMPDTTYVNPFELLHFVNHINWNRKVAIGGSLTNDNKCTLQAGILLSNPAMQSLIQQRHICNSIVSSSDHTAFEMCIRHATNLSCVSQYQGMTYNWWKVDENKINVDRSGGITIHDKVNLWSKSTEFNESICVSPLLSEADVRALHEHFIHVQLNKIDAKIDKLVEEIDSMSDYISDGPTWPIGIPSYSKPPNRYQVPKWEFFTSDEIFKNEPNHNVHALIGDDKADVDEVVQSARDFIENKADEMEGTGMEFVKLQNGYRLFDAMRGMDYMVDLIYRNKVSPETFIRRVHLTRAIASTQLMHQVPYVKEDTDLTIVIPLGSSTTNINAEIGALNRLLSIYSRICQSTNIGETRQTRIVVTARNVDQSAIDSINNHLVDLSLRCKSSGTDTMLLLLKGDSHPMISVASLDEAINHFGHQMIYLLLSPHADIQREFLDRVRINTIKHFQVILF
ncbi:unnamed protein product [Anisakis simplex]|uniref:Hexosyltransferase n=1 Tax=Anisakis simplex TaxID=6269 RepID=A0A0M3K1D2_ANISI|nr:unnamed protein product [Anisakis simplex]